MEGDPALSIFSEARHEYTKQLSQHLKQPYLRFFLDLLEQSKQEMVDQPRRFLWQFQTHLKEMRDWNADKADREINKIQSASGCDFLEELLTAIFIAHTKVLTSIRISVKKKKINIVVPKLVHFLFRALCECADLLWSSAFLFRDDVSPIEKQQNMRQVEGLILEGFQNGIRSLLPVKSILRDLVPDEDDGEEGEGEGEEAEVSVQGSVETTVVAPEPIITENAQKVLDAFTDTATTDKEITTLCVNKPVVEVTKEEAPVFTVDTRKRVSFSEHDGVFQDEEDETESFFEPSSQGTSELADGSASFTILEDTAAPLGLDDCEDIDGVNNNGLEAEDFETM